MTRAVSKWSLWRPTLSGLALGLLFWLAAVTPTLIPRTWPVQAGISGVSLAVGYGLGTLAGRVIQSLLDRQGRSLGPVVRQRVLVALGIAWPVGVLIGTFLWVDWQNAQRSLMGMPPVGWGDALQMAATSLVIAAVIVILGRGVGRAVAALHRAGQRVVPVSFALTWTVLMLLAVVVVLGGVASRAATVVANYVYAPVNEQTNPGTQMPGSATVSGSSDSFAAWDTLGRMGRDFVASATAEQQMEICRANGTVPTEPVRVYVGVQSAESVEDRVALAVRELERTGGFDRSVLAVWVPTGSGWMIQEASSALEQLHCGDTAIVAIQYSFLPSILAVFLDAGLANEAGDALFNAVHARWSELPPDQRPRLVLFGKSLGTAGVEEPFVEEGASASVADFVSRADGALIVGAKYSNPILTQVTRDRDAGSPVWQPVFDQGRVVRFFNRGPDQEPPASEWSFPRLVYLQHPSDPVTFWSVDALWRPPEWMDRPRGHDVPEAARWFPIVSGIQAVGDMLLQLDVPPGFGHDYATDYVNGWAQVLPPEGWTDADTERLEQLLTTGEGESEP